MVYAQSIENVLKVPMTNILDLVVCCNLFQALVGPNVHGTANVIKFACDGKIKPIHYIR